MYKAVPRIRTTFPRFSDSRKLSIILKSYVILNMINETEQYYRENFITPFLDSVVTRVSPFPHFSPSRSESMATLGTAATVFRCSSTLFEAT